MNQDLKPSEKLFCLSVDPKSGGIFFNSSSTLYMTLVGLMFVELVNKEIITIENEAVHLVNPTHQYDEIHEYILNPIRLWKKDLRIRIWISWFYFRGSKIKKLFIQSLVRKSVLRVEEKWFLFIPYHKVCLMDRELVESIRKEVEMTILGRTAASDESIILAQMVAQNNLFERIFPDKAKQKEADFNLNKFPETQVSRAVKLAIHMRNARFAALR